MDWKPFKKCSSWAAQLCLIEAKYNSAVLNYHSDNCVDSNTGVGSELSPSYMHLFVSLFTDLYPSATRTAPVLPMPSTLSVALMVLSIFLPAMQGAPTSPKTPTTHTEFRSVLILCSFSWFPKYVWIQCHVNSLRQYIAEISNAE